MTSNKLYIALANGDGSFEYQNIEDFGSRWTTYDPLVGDIDNDGKDEFIWSNTNGSTLGIHSSDYEGPGMTLNNYRNIGGAGSWDGYSPFIGDIDGGGDDLIISSIPLSDSHLMYTSGYVNDRWTDRTVTHRTAPGTLTGWNPYVILVGNVDGNINEDLVFNALQNRRNTIHKDLAKGDGTFSMPDHQEHPASADEDWSKFEVNLVDVNNDGKSDLVWSIKATGETTNKVYVALATDSGDFDFSPVMQSHPAVAVWSQYKSFPMDLNGDGKVDMMWVNEGGSTSVFVGLAR